MLTVPFSELAVDYLLAPANWRLQSGPR